jgi:4-hydroxy-tetrahydrodipicolinate reductase
MQNAYQVMVWGPGKMGSVAIWEVLQSPAFELTGVRVYSEHKNGKDVGELLGIEPLNLLATTDTKKLLAQPCDCIIYTALDTGDYKMDDEILELLASGKNVVTPLPYQNAHLFREQSFLDKLTAACKKGGSVFHATGIDPDIISDSVLMGLTGICTDVSSIKLREFWECSAGDPNSLAFLGYGKTPEEAKKVPIAEASTTNFMQAIARTVEKTLGVKYDKLEQEYDYVATDKDIEEPLLIKKGTVARLVSRINGYVDAKGSEPFFSFEYNWFVSYDMLPEGIQPDQYWVATIEGRPSLKMSIDLKASHEKNERFFKIGNMVSEAGYHGTIAPCLHSIPHICNAEPGVLPSFSPNIHWKQDPRIQ